MEHQASGAVAEEIRVALARQRHSQRWLSAQTGINPSALSRSLKGIRPFTVDEITVIAPALGLSVADLLTGAAA